MPPEPKAKLKRRSSKRELESEFKFDGGHARELEIKRSRGFFLVDLTILSVTQAERLFFAMSQCLATGQGTRFVLAATEHLHRRISKLSGRIRELEDALASLHSKHSTQPHPLLDESLIEVAAEEGDVVDKVKAIVGDEPAEVINTGGGDAIDAFGTLSISDHGISRFFGPTGGSESLLMSNMGSEKHSSPKSTQPRSVFRSSASPSANCRDPSSVSPISASNSLLSGTSGTASFSSATLSNVEGELSATYTLFSRAFPFTPLGLPLSEVQSLIKTHIPPYETAMDLVKIFFDQIAWLFRGLTYDQVVEDMIPAIYGRRGSHAGEREGDYEDVTMHKEAGSPEAASEVHTEEEWNGPHDLALLFIVFALGALFGSDEKDTGPPPASRPEDSDKKEKEEADGLKASKYHQVPPVVEHYHQLCRAALSLQPILEKPSIVTIQALHLLSIYNAMSGDGDDRLGKGESGMEMTWSLISLCSHLAMTIGLHRDSARWGLTPKMIQRRRILFWDLFVADVWTSLTTGRPPAFSLAYIDCSFPQYDTEGFNTKGKPEDQAFELWQFRFAAECVAEISARTLTAEAPTYTTIMELDRRVREFPLPDMFVEKDANRRSASDEDVAFSFQKRVVEHVKETMLIYIHRSFFAQAIIEQPVNPLKSPYAPSFLAAYRASGTILKSVREHFSVFPNATARHWSMWTFAFSAAVIFGTVVTRGPRSPLAQSAMVELDQACVLFSKASVYSVRASKALPILMKLREKAQCALVNVRNSTAPLSADNSGLLWNIKQEDAADELSIFAGHTRFISARQKSGSPALVDSPPLSAAQEVPHPPGQIRISTDPIPNVNNSSSMQDRGRYGGDVAMELDHPYDSTTTPRSSYQIPRTQQPYRPPQPPQVRLPQLSNLGPLQEHGTSPTSGVSPISSAWRDDPDFGRQSNPPPHRYAEPTTISIPPATPPPSAHPRHERPPPQQSHPVHYGYSYDRETRPNPPGEYSWPPQEQQYPPPPPPDSAPIRLSHPQYMHQHQHQGHMYRPSQEMYNHPPPSQGMGSYHGYPSQSGLPHQAGPGPGPGNAHLAGLGLASRDSRLDERWSSFMQDSGLLDDVNYPRGR
ncbi:hypothetical protein V5O48_006683 [Marasmius crinis-equi]|uniref:Xylanolytic transcriptional activator regulatory domain-containing protein n=1 Tax=Marasmius crinis-equi TaxID=585013 RepID=A0ABR3FJ80_9AGAR